MSRETQNLVLFLLGVAVLKTTLDGSFMRYVKPSLEPYLLISGTVIVVLAAAAMITDIRAGGPSSFEHDHNHNHGHGHTDRMPWLLMAPALVVLFLAPPALGPGSFVERQVQPPSSSADLRAFDPIPEGTTPEMTFSEVLQRNRLDSAGTLDDREIAVRGYAVARADGGVDLARIVIICCAADARTAKIKLTGPEATRMTDVGSEQWWRVVGTVIPGSATEQNEFVPEMRVVSVERTTAPENTYSY